MVFLTHTHTHKQTKIQYVLYVRPPKPNLSCWLSQLHQKMNPPAPTKSCCAMVAMIDDLLTFADHVASVTWMLCITIFNIRCYSDSRTDHGYNIIGTMY